MPKKAFSFYNFFLLGNECGHVHREYLQSKLSIKFLKPGLHIIVWIVWIAVNDPNDPDRCNHWKRANFCPSDPARHDRWDVGECFSKIAGITGVVHTIQTITMMVLKRCTNDVKRPGIL